MEHGLLGRELADGRQDAARVAGEEDDVGGVVLGDAGDLGVGDVVDRVGAGEGIGSQRSRISMFEKGRRVLPSGVFRESGVVVVCLPGFWVKDDVLENGAESDGVEDVGFFLGREVDGFGVALIECQRLECVSVQKTARTPPSMLKTP